VHFTDRIALLRADASRRRGFCVGFAYYLSADKLWYDYSLGWCLIATVENISVSESV
jgi:hypothetical protein